jgi:hypothetical protein
MKAMRTPSNIAASLLLVIGCSIGGCAARRSPIVSRPDLPADRYVGWRASPVETVLVERTTDPVVSVALRKDEMLLGWSEMNDKFDEPALCDFARSIGATKVLVSERHSVSMWCIVPPYPPPGWNAHRTDYGLWFVAPSESTLLSGYPPQWEKRVRGTMNRRQLPEGTPVEVIDRSTQRTWPTEADRVSSRGGELDWRAEDQPFRDRLPDFARKLGCDRVVFAGMWGPGQEADETPQAIYVWFYDSKMVRPAGS